MSEQLETKVLDNGYVKFIEAWGSDERIIESARMSTNAQYEIRVYADEVCKLIEQHFPRTAQLFNGSKI